MSRFRKPKTADEEINWLQDTTPKNTRNSTKWSAKIFEEWQKTRANRFAENESIGFPCSEIEATRSSCQHHRYVACESQFLDDDVGDCQ